MKPLELFIHMLACKLANKEHTIEIKTLQTFFICQYGRRCEVTFCCFARRNSRIHVSNENEKTSDEYSIRTGPFLHYFCKTSVCKRICGTRVCGVVLESLCVTHDNQNSISVCTLRSDSSEVE